MTVECLTIVNLSGSFLSVVLNSALADRLTGKKLTPYYHDDPKEGLARGMHD